MKAWLYYRLSRDEDEEMNSLYNQRQILVDYAEQQGYEIVGESSDDNVSGMTFDRKGLAKLENAVDEGKVDVVLVKDLGEPIGILRIVWQCMWRGRRCKGMRKAAGVCLRLYTIKAYSLF